VLTCSDDRSVIIWEVGKFGNGNNHQKTDVERDRAIHSDISPDGKAAILALNFNNTVRPLKIENSTLKSKAMTDLPCLNDSLDLLSAHFGYACKQRNSIKPILHPFILSLYSKPGKKPQICISDINGNHLKGSPIDPCLGEINCLKLSPKRNVFACCGFASNLKIWEVADDKFILKQICSISVNSQAFHLAFDQTDEKIVLLTKDGVEVFDFSDHDYPKRITKFSIPEEIPAKNFKFVQFKHFCNTLYLSYENTVYIMKEGELVEKMDNIVNECITSIQILPKHNYLLVSGGKTIRVLQI